MHSETRQRTGFLVVSSQIKDEERKKKKTLMLLVIFLSFVWVLLFSYLLLAKTKSTVLYPRRCHILTTSRLSTCDHSISTSVTFESSPQSSLLSATYFSGNCLNQCSLLAVLPSDFNNLIILIKVKSYRISVKVFRNKRQISSVRVEAYNVNAI